MSTSVVSNMGASVAINSGGTDVVVLTDVNGDGRIGRGDGYLVASQSKGFGNGGAAVVSGVFGSCESMEGSGDPHLFGYSRSVEAEGTLINEANRLFADARDNGQIDASGGSGAFVSSLTAGADIKFVGDFHSDVTLTHLDARTSVDFDVVTAPSNDKIAYTDGVDYRAANGQVITIKEVWAGNGGAGQMSVSDTTSLQSSRAVANRGALEEIHDMVGAKVRIGTIEFSSETTGSHKMGTDKSYIIDSKGDVRNDNGGITRAAYDDFRATYDNVKWMNIGLSFAVKKDDENDDRRLLPQPAAASPGRG